MPDPNVLLSAVGQNLRLLLRVIVGFFCQITKNPPFQGFFGRFQYHFSRLAAFPATGDGRERQNLLFQRRLKSRIFLYDADIGGAKLNAPAAILSG
jgi:hypothetical protein